MKPPFALACLAAALAAAAPAQGITKPGRTLVEQAPIVALSATGIGFTYAVGDNAAKTDCAHVVAVQTGGATARWRLGKPTDEPCSEGLSTGSGISAVAVAENRSVWIQYAGGNLRDWQLYTATRTKRTPLRLAFVEQDVNLPSPMVIGQGSPYGVPYAVGKKLTFLADNGSAFFKWNAPSPVRLVSASVAGVVAVLDSGEVDLLSQKGKVVVSYPYAPGDVTAAFVSPAGVVVQAGSTVAIRNGTKQRTFALPAKAQMFDYAEGRIYYSLAGGIHALGINSHVDSLLVAPIPGKTVLASVSVEYGFAWAIGNVVNWDCAKCVNYGR